MSLSLSIDERKQDLLAFFYMVSADTTQTSCIQGDTRASSVNLSDSACTQVHY